MLLSQLVHIQARMPYCKACRILVSQPGIKLIPCKGSTVPTTGPPGKSPQARFFFWVYSLSHCVTQTFLPYFLALCLLLLLLLSRFSHVWLCVTPETAAHQAPPFLGFSRQEHWSGLPFPSPVHESEVTQSCPTLATPWTAAHQAPPPMGFSRQKYWSGVLLPSPVSV